MCADFSSCGHAEASLPSHEQLTARCAFPITLLPWGEEPSTAMRERHFADQGFWGLLSVLNSPTSHTYMEPSLFSNRRICQNCSFAATYIKVRSSGARALHSCISLLSRFPVLESRAWICLIQAIVCVGGRRGNICYCRVPPSHLPKQSVIGISFLFASEFPPSSHHSY